MDSFRRDILELLYVQGKQNALLLAGELDCDTQALYEELCLMKREGLVRNPPGEDEWGPEPVEGCEAWFVTHAHWYAEWIYSAGPFQVAQAGSEMAISRC